MPQRSLLISLAGLLLLAAVAEAQRPVFRRTLPEERRSTFGFAARSMFGVDMTLENLGTINYPALAAGDEVEGRQEYIFGDGYVFVDEGADLTSSFGFAWENATIVDAPTASDPDRQLVTEFALSRYRSNSIGESRMTDEGTNYGWEFTYQYQWGKTTDRFRLGLMGGLAFNNLDYSFQGEVEGEGVVQRFVITPTNPFLYPGTPSGSYQGSPLGGPEIDPGQIDLGAPESPTLEWDAELGEFVPAPTQVAVGFDYDGVMAMMRLGPTASVRIIDELTAELSAGVVGVYVSSRIRLNQVLLNLPTTVDNTSLVKDQGDYLLGFFGEGLLRYQMTRRVGFYSSLVYMKVQEFDDTGIGTATYDLSLQAPIFATAGMRLTF